MAYHTTKYNNNNDEPPIARRNTPHTIENCSLFVGQPISREQAVAKMERSPQFADAVQRFGGSHEQDDVVQNAVQLDYGMRLRNCLAAGHSHPSERYGRNNNNNNN